VRLVSLDGDWYNASVPAPEAYRDALASHYGEHLRQYALRRYQELSKVLCARQHISLAGYCHGSLEVAGGSIVFYSQVSDQKKQVDQVDPNVVD